MKNILAALAVSAMLSACSTTRVGMQYAASTAPSPPLTDAQAVEVGTFVDERGEAPNYVGAIRGGFGNPLKAVETENPVAEVVRAAFSDGLRARGVAVDASAAPLRLSGIVRTFDCNQVARREANVQIGIRLIDRASGRALVEKSVSASNIDGSLVSMKVGVFASVEDLRALTEKTLRETVDRALDDPQVRAALRSRRDRPQGTP